MKIMDNIPVWGEHEERTLGQIRTCAALADRAALMADGHLCYAVPIGGVIAWKDAIQQRLFGHRTMISIYTLV